MKAEYMQPQAGLEGEKKAVLPSLLLLFQNTGPPGKLLMIGTVKSALDEGERECVANVLDTDTGSLFTLIPFYSAMNSIIATSVACFICAM